MCESHVLTLVPSVSRGRLCLRRSERAASPAPSDCPRRVSRCFKGRRSKQKENPKVANFFPFAPCRSHRVAALPPAGLLLLVVDGGQQTGWGALLSLAEPQRQAALQVTFRRRPGPGALFHFTPAFVVYNFFFLSVGGRGSLSTRRCLWTLVRRPSTRARWEAHISKVQLEWLLAANKQ